MYPFSIVSLLFSFVAYAVGSAVDKRQATTTTSSSSSTTSLVADSACTNDAKHRACWSNGFSIATDFDQKHPTTGNTVYYDWTITNTTGDPDGTGERMLFLIDGQYPGPTLYAEWGDWISVTIHNDLSNNGTGIHWHGIRQLNTVDQDGVPGITECPIAPKSSRNYLFQATQFGTSWYHSHFSVQYGQGIVGPIIINGPATSNYDVDLGTFPITDWYPLTAFQEGIIARSGPPAASNGLINGTMVSPDGSGGAYYKSTITAGKKYRVRIINTSVDNHFMVSLDNHPFTVITSDFVPIKPYTAKWIFVGIGQRYDVIINANQAPDNYWFRAIVPAGCGANSNTGNIKSIFHYSNATDSDPTSTAYDVTERCTDEQGLVPYWDSFIPSDPLTADPTSLNISASASVVGNGTNVFTWAVNFTALNVDWDKPILEYIQEGNTSYPKAANVVSLAEDADWTYWVLTEVAGSDGKTPAINVPHPIHLHGHDFYVLGADTVPFTPDVIAGLNFDNPPRRDTAMLPGGGYLVFAFETNNAGAWITHCHIAWHVSDGLGVQFLENPDQIKLGTQFNDVCSTWRDYYPEEAMYLKDDSGV